VFQYQTLSKYASSEAWNVAQWFLSAVLSHASLFDGASPNHSATAAFASGEMMWFIHR
jgi:hypothetical protein